MKKLLAIVIAGLAVATSAQADVLTYEYTVKISRITEFELTGYKITPVQTTTMPGAAITIGDTVTGRFSIDSATQLWSSGPDGTGATSNYSPVSAYGNHNGFSARFEQSGLVVPHILPISTNMIVTDHPSGAGADVFDFSGSTESGTTSTFMAINFTDPSGNALADTGIPHTLNGLNAGTFVYHFSNYNPSLVVALVNGDVTSLRQMPLSPVPEPGCYAMLLAGLGLLAWRGKRLNKRAA